MYAYVCAYIYIYMFICSELIEETGRPSGLIFESWKEIHTFDGVITYCHIFEGVKNHINADISHPIRDRIMKT